MPKHLKCQICMFQSYKGYLTKSLCPSPKFEVNKSEIAMTFILEVLNIYKESKNKHQKHSCLPSVVCTSCYIAANQESLVRTDILLNMVIQITRNQLSASIITINPFSYSNTIVRFLQASSYPIIFQKVKIFILCVIHYISSTIPGTKTLC